MAAEKFVDRIEERNDRTLILFIVALGAIGVFYGAETGSNWIRDALGALFYGFVGAAIGATLAFGINITRNWR